MYDESDFKHCRPQMHDIYERTALPIEKGGDVGIVFLSATSIKAKRFF